MSPTWKDVLASRTPPAVVEELDIFENQVELRQQGKIEEKVFAELRLRRGAYGQRYDNGKRYDGAKTQEIPYPRRGLTKGPDTEWEAPGMQRIKIPFGRLTAEQLEVLADCAEEYSNAVLHITTRQDVQLHFVDIEDTPDMHRRLASVGITTREACGNSVRNVTGCPHAGVCANEAFDISPYARAETYFLLGHRDVQDFGRKFKIAYSGCAQDACGRAMMHDLGFIAAVRTIDGHETPGFQVVVGGGLGPVPHVAKELYDFIPATRMLPVSQAIARVYARLGEKRNRNKARIKFLVAKLGIVEFKRLVEEELAERNPRRWSGSTRNWTPVTAVTLNPERDIRIKAATSQIPLFSSIGEPAFPTRPGSAQATARNEGDGRSRAPRSHAQSALAHEHGEDGEHPTFSEESTVAHSLLVGGSQRRIAMSPVRRLRQ